MLYAALLFQILPVSFVTAFVTLSKPIGKYPSERPTSFDNLTAEQCSFVVVRGFIKEKCLVDSRWYYKCPFSHDFYKEIQVKCRIQEFSHLCPNDPSFYQSCGHTKCSQEPQDIHKGRGVCGDILCEKNYVDPWQKSTKVVDSLLHGGFVHYRCDGESQCKNVLNGTSADERECTSTREMVNCGPCPLDDSFVSTVSRQLVCDDVCDCVNCYDEAHCHNRTVGIVCRINPREVKVFACISSIFDYIEPKFICDGIRHCARGQDERGCNANDTCAGLPGSRQTLHFRNKCSVLETKHKNLHFCIDYRDQMNCTDSSVSPLQCEVDGYPTTISQHIICKDFRLCDDNLDNACIEVTLNCKIHKHRLCDGAVDCSGNVDEGEYFCGTMTQENIGCVRKLSSDRKGSSIPVSWVMDGVKDCVNAVDEEPSLWDRVCGTGNIARYSYQEKSICSNIPLFKCPGSNNYLRNDDLCRGILNCDTLFCKIVSRKGHLRSYIQQINNEKRLFHCFNGLYNLQIFLGACSPIPLQNDLKAHGVVDNVVLITSIAYSKFINCQDIFGELYLYLSCTDQCNQNVACPLKSLTYKSCVNYLGSRTLTITSKYQLTIAVRRSNGAFDQDLFSCDNFRCVEYSKVCDLVDDCGDDSDEKHCSNNFKCKRSGIYIPISRKCDGVFDCTDYSDECNDECDNQVKIFRYDAIHGLAWVFGLIATVLNIAVIVKGFISFSSIKTEIARINESFVLLISSGDLLQGIYLLFVVISDTYFNDSTCQTQFKWVTSKICTSLGIISTIGSQVSLYSMTILSIFRARGLTNSVKRPREEMTGKNKIFLVSGIFGTYFLATVVAIIPMIPLLKELFDQQLIYSKNPLFVGKLNKHDHQRILKAYYGRLSRKHLTWYSIRKLVKDIFINIDVVGNDVGFYGANGFCLFNYFVRSDNHQRWFSCTILATNMLCVLIIATSYIIVTKATSKSITIAGQHNQSHLKRNRKIQRKLSILIMTDIFAWIPFFFVCFIHFFEISNTARWHSVFSVVIIPLNSVVNPVLILEDLILGIIKV